MKPPAETIAKATTDLIQPGEVLFIATDERKKEFFDVFTHEHRYVRTLGVVVVVAGLRGSVCGVCMRTCVVTVVHACVSVCHSFLRCFLQRV